MDLQSVFCNYRISRARRIVENVFGIMSSVFRIFHSTMSVNLENVQSIVMTCAYLHNFLRRNKHAQNLYNPIGTFDVEDTDNGAIIPGSWRNDDQRLTDLSHYHARNSTALAKETRDEFMHYFMSDRGRVAWQDIYLG